MTASISKTAPSEVASYMKTLGRAARAAAVEVARASTAAKNSALLAIAIAIEAGPDSLAAANARDLAAAEGLDAVMHSPWSNFSAALWSAEPRAACQRQQQRFQFVPHVADTAAFN